MQRNHAQQHDRIKDAVKVFQTDLFFRALIGFATFLVCIVLYFSGLKFIPIIRISLVCAFVVLINILHNAFLKRSGNPFRLVTGFCILDVLVITYIIHLTGGVNASVLVLGYTLVILYAGITLPTRVPYLLAFFSMVFYSLLFYIEEATHFSIPGAEDSFSWGYMMARMWATGFLLLITAWFASNFSRQLKEKNLNLLKSEKRYRLEVIERKQAEEEVRKLNEDLENRVKQRTRDLEKAYDELKELDKTKDVFISSVSHEFRTPLTSIRSFSEILLQYDDVDPATRREFLQIINSESERLTRLVGDVLDLSRIEARKMVWHDSILSLEEVIQDVIRAQRPLLQQKSLELTLEISSPLPTILADANRIRQVVMNLLENAIKFSLKGGQIRIQATRVAEKRPVETQEWVQVSVSDRGVGIRVENSDIIFDKFHQVSLEDLNEKPRGTGLGLPICKEIVTHYKGNIWFRSRENQGTTFFFTLPVS